ncbi:hypothetical protein POM88_010601 [Heracleum sosnowskyi]|uniref:RRM domain-containing protein n=1 Tax=Heracleum sosnowskyi TaxID=360622 RepID=A0AAD8MVW2_9APIA|nr:hypothetical protein POM88_010601 [Heracleum sosnowskyi]
MLKAIVQGNDKLIGQAAARIRFMKEILEGEVLEAACNGDEEVLQLLRLHLMNEGWWNKVVNVDLRKSGNSNSNQKPILKPVRLHKPNNIPVSGLLTKEEEKNLLGNFILNKRELVHPNVIKMVQADENEGIRMTLNQIHYGTLRTSRQTKEIKKGRMGCRQEEGHPKGSREKGKPRKGYDNVKFKKSFADILKDNKHPGQTQQKIASRFSESAHNSTDTLFFSDFEEGAKVVNIWKVLKRIGRVRDIILPRKKDRYNKRFGFIKPMVMSCAKSFMRLSNKISIGGNKIRIQWAKKYADKKERGVQLKNLRRIAPTILHRVIILVWRGKTTAANNGWE